jgi:hypothetical protein
MQMSSLVRLQLLTVVGDDHVDLPRYKCAVDLEFISTVARLVAIMSVVLCEWRALVNSVLNLRVP